MRGVDVSVCTDDVQCVQCVQMKSSHFLHLELLEVGATFLPRCSHDIQEVRREHEGNPLLTDSHEALIIPQDVAEIDVEEVPCRNTKEITLSFLGFPPKLHG